MGEIDIPPIGARVRAERLRRGISLRGLARQAGVSPSLVSQVETGRIRPSVSTLYAVTGALGISVADLLKAPAAHSGADGGAGGSPVATAGLAAMLALNPMTSREGPEARTAARPVASPRQQAVSNPGEREVITLDSGVVWEVLGRLPGENVDFLRITYQPGSASSSGELMVHPGTEYGFLEFGVLMLELGDGQQRLSGGSAVSFRSSTPHRYRNEGSTPAVGIWIVIDE